MTPHACQQAIASILTPIVRPCYVALVVPDLDDDSILAEHVPAPTLKSRGTHLSRREELKAIEQGILVSALEVVSHTLDFAEIERDDQRPPQEWIDEMGAAAAMRRFRVAKEGWASAKEAAVGIKVATQIAAASIKASAMTQAAKTLNVALIGIVTPPKTPSEFEEVIVDGHE